MPDYTGFPYSELGTVYTLPEAQLEIVTWTPALHGKHVIGEQVHLMFYVKEGFQFVVRLKSKAAVNRVIGALVEHRDDALWEEASDAG